LSANPEQQYFADGISEELLNLLAQIDELRVISRSTAFSFKGQPTVAPEVARKLNVAYIMEGSVRQAGNRVRITAQLIDARTDTHLWSEVYDRELDDVFAIQDEIAQHVVEELQLELLVKAPKAEDVDARAHDLYLRARYLLETGDSRADELEAIGLLESALRIAPEWLRAKEQLLRIYMRFAFDSDKDDAALYRARSWDMLEKMIAVDPQHSITLNWIGWLEWHLRGDPRAAAPYFEQALEEDPRNDTLLHGVALYLAFLNRYEEAIAVGEYLLLNDPACATCVTGLAFYLRQTGQAKEAAERLDAMRAWYPGNISIEWSVGSAWILAGEPQKALDIFQERDVPPSQNLGLLLALHDLGREEEFEAAFADYREGGAEYAEPIARIYAWIGNADEAFRWLEILVEREGPEFAEFARTDFYRKLHTDPRWTAFLQANGQSEEELGRIEFDPSYPPEIEQMLRRPESGQVP
jgi:TolB-like protein/thioredoxin-like negative regulator of GroEL